MTRASQDKSVERHMLLQSCYLTSFIQDGQPGPQLANGCSAAASVALYARLNVCRRGVRGRYLRSKKRRDQRIVRACLYLEVYS